MEREIEVEDPYYDAWDALGDKMADQGLELCEECNEFFSPEELTELEDIFLCGSCLKKEAERICLEKAREAR